MSKNAIHRRLEGLEERIFGADPFRDFPDWSLEDQLEDVLDTLAWQRRFHGNGNVRYPATDRELHLLGFLCAHWKLLEEGGEHRFPSGTLVAWQYHVEDEAWSVNATGYVGLEDLPGGVREHFERMDPKKHPERDGWLYGDRLRAKRDRERIAWHDEHGWDKPTPEHPRRYWEDGGVGGGGR